MEIVRVRQEGGDDLVLPKVGDLINCATYQAPTPRALYHGSPIAPDELGPQIDPRLAVFFFKGQRIAHGEHSVVSMSSTLGFPVIRSLIHYDHPDMPDNGFHLDLSRRLNRAQQPFFFTSVETVEQLRDSHGYVYGANHPPTSAKPYAERQEIDEWRVPEPVVWDWAGRVTLHDFPASLLVVDGDHEQIDTFIEAFEASMEHPLTVGQETGVNVQYWDTWSQSYFATAA